MAASPWPPHGSWSRPAPIYNSCSIQSAKGRMSDLSFHASGAHWASREHWASPRCCDIPSPAKTTLSAVPSQHSRRIATRGRCSSLL